MHNKLLFQRLTFISNIVACAIFFGLVIYNVLNREPLNRNENTIGFIALSIFVMLYMTADLAGLNLLSKLKQHASLSRRSIIWIIVLLIIQSLIQILLACGIYLGLKNLFSLTGNQFALKFYITLLAYYGITIFIFLSSVYTIFSTISLIKKVRKNQVEFNNLIQEIGSKTQHT